MPLIENEFEQALLQELPPHARDIALDFMGTYSLGELLEALQANEPDKELLQRKKVPSSYWEPILKATLLAKCTYFIPNPEFRQEERLFLIKVACMSAGFPLSTFSLVEILEISHQKMPVLNQWLKRLTADLQENNALFKAGDKPKAASDTGL
ncbi:hypothetical protein AVO42_02275 [Thiomicrospira sp. XS5]|uniref:hypothetical protein n=1 Tax=Thiomicrospira sp. XS5 TaxID=1775636 RepID=UPI00074634AB|nr:hypothetical protein [Thiomicrospira sp. XS5]KUJ74264.1 hypothetical protein AVO42_02275 [Thiomicrospira sp. XS5]